MSRKDKISGHAAESEKYLERRLVKECEARGCLCLKYYNPQMVGYPDRIILLPRGLVVWAEVKSRGCRPTVMQQYRHKQLRRLGHEVFIIDSVESINALCAWI